jgi:hypothetical protein
MEKIVNINNLKIGSNRETWKELNLQKNHKVPIGTLVEVKWDNWEGNGMYSKYHVRLRVSKHTRDCDGEPLYSISKYTPHVLNQIKSNLRDLFQYNGFNENQLKIITENADRLNGKTIFYK